MINKVIRLLLSAFLAIVIALTSSFWISPIVNAQRAETCPSSGDWVKIDNIDAQSYTYEVPEGKVVVKICYKAGRGVVYDLENSDLGQPLVFVKTSVLNPKGNAFLDISHASFMLVDALVITISQHLRLLREPTSEPTKEPTPDPAEPAVTPETSASTCVASVPVVETTPALMLLRQQAHKQGQQR